VLGAHASEAASRLAAVLDQIDLIDLNQRIRILAGMVTPAPMRSWTPSTLVQPCTPARH
jgi:hypothetical protein